MKTYMQKNFMQWEKLVSVDKAKRVIKTSEDKNNSKKKSYRQKSL